MITMVFASLDIWIDWRRARAHLSVSVMFKKVHLAQIELDHNHISADLLSECLDCSLFEIKDSISSSTEVTSD